ncbi:hypothetical protein [Amylibacter marinus]|nr:hypothetical protein [Amylibacter marinus]
MLTINTGWAFLQGANTGFTSHLAGKQGAWGYAKLALAQFRGLGECIG